MLRVLAGILFFCFVTSSVSFAEDLRKLSGWEELANLAQNKIVLFGDTHSKKGSANTIVSYLEYLGKTDRSVLIGIEISSSEQSRLDTFMASDGSETAVTALLSDSPFWEHPGAHDGRANAAWLNVIKMARDMREDGQSITLIAIIVSHPPGVNWDGPAANGFMETMTGEKFDTAIVLAGNLHTIQSEFPLNLDYPFGYYLGSQNIISLNPNGLPFPHDFRVSNCPNADGKFTGVYLRSDIFAINDTRKYDGAFCANMRRAPYASPKTEAAFKKRLGRN